MNPKVDKTELDYQLKLSQGKGMLTDRCSTLLYQVCKKTFEVKRGSFEDEDDRDDVFSEGVLAVFKNWHKVDLTYGRSGYNYIVELFKTGTYHSISNILKLKNKKGCISLDTLDFS